MIHTQLAEFLTYVPKLQEKLTKTASAGAVSKEFLLQAVQSTAVGLFTAAKRIYGSELLEWEPETLWMTMSKDGIDLPESERNKLQAAIALELNPAFYWDNLAFQRTVHALNGELFDPDSLLECHPAHMCWAVYEAGVLRGLDTTGAQIPDFDGDVQQYAAVCLFRSGMVTAPEPLSDFCEENLENLFPVGSSAPELKKEVKVAWAKLDKDALANTEFDESALGVQLAKLAACYLYVKRQADLMSSELAKLTSP